MSTLMSQARNRVPRFAEAAVERARLTVVPRRVQTAPRVPFVTLVSLLLVGGVVGLLLFNTNMQQASFVATSMEQRAALLDARQQSLRMEIERLRDPQRVAARARQLGMVPATNPAFLRLPDGAVLGTPAPASAEDALRIMPLPAPKPAALRPAPVVLDVPTPARPARAERNKTRDTASASPEAAREAGKKRQQQSERSQGSRR